MSQIPGIGEVTVGGGALPAVRVQVNPDALHQHGLTLEDVRARIVESNVNRPKGFVEQGERHWQIEAERPGAPARRLCAADHPLQQRCGGASGRCRRTVADSVQDVRNLGLTNGQPPCCWWCSSGRAAT
jgi:multidrug efflux pump subunit AcrB